MIVEPRIPPAVGALILALFLAACPRTEEGDFPRGRLVIETASGSVTIDVEIAETLDQRIQGLRDREELAPDAGMVFLPEEPTRQRFTMQDTLIPLSLAVWEPDGRIRVILDMDPCRQAPCPTHDPGVDSAGAVEVNQGFFEEHGVAVGDAVRLERR